LYSESDFLQLSGIQHYSYCRRQWALAYLEMQWEENERTFEGHILHENAHDPFLKESRGDYFLSRALPIHSYSLGLSGECDVVIFKEDEKGISISVKKGKYLVIPVEYKKGKPKNTDDDIVQLVAQAICLEEMMYCSISYGYLYYGETKHREKINISSELREKVKKYCQEMHEYAEKDFIPKVKRHKGCNACSLENICFPETFNKDNVSSYIKKYAEDINDA